MALPAPFAAIKDMNWVDGSQLCSHSTLFFEPSEYENPVTKEEREAKAKKICQACELQEPCLAWALSRDEGSGIWGGKTKKERRDLQKRLNA